MRYPKLRPVDVRPVAHNGEHFVLLRDPLQLSGKTLVVPQLLATILPFCDGSREDSGAIGASLAIRLGLRVDNDVVEQVLAALDDALLLENDRFAAARERALAEYREASFRTPALAGPSYPADPEELRTWLDSFVDGDGIDCVANTSRGLVSPHIDYMRGGPVYARVWSRAREAVKEADLAVVFGTDHYGSDTHVSLTRQNYATPFGVLPTASDIVVSLADAIGAEHAFGGELRHRGEHSIELASVWLHYMREGKECEVVPILCGSFVDFVRGGADPEGDPVINGLLSTLKQKTEGRRVLVIAAGDLAHVGPAFGGEPIDISGRAALKRSDEELVDRICAGDAAGFLKAISDVEDRNNVCGVSAIYLALRLLGQGVGEAVAYDRCPADEHGTSLVSVCGVVIE